MVETPDVNPQQDQRSKLSVGVAGSNKESSSDQQSTPIVQPRAGRAPRKRNKKSTQTATKVVDGEEDPELEKLLSEMIAENVSRAAAARNAGGQSHGAGPLGEESSVADAAVPPRLTSPRLLPKQDNSRFRRLGDWNPVTTLQSDPPCVPVAELFPSESHFPLGQELEYKGGSSGRPSNAEKRELERIVSANYESLREAAECHRQVRKFAQSYIQPGMSMIEICKRLEAKTEQLIGADKTKRGKGFPTGCSINHVAAHYTPNYGDSSVLQYEDIVKLDFGVQVDGWIIDSAFTFAFDPKFDELIQATIDGTNTGIREAGIDARMQDIGAAVQEVIESFEFQHKGTRIPIKPVENLYGHSIARYQVHGGKSVPVVRNGSADRMEEGEVYAIETFASTGKGRVTEVGECSHYMRDYMLPPKPGLRLKTAKDLLDTINDNFGSLAFCRRWLDDLGHARHTLPLKNLVENDIVTPYPPLADIQGSFVSQMEHTILLKPTGKEVLSRGDDY